MHPDLTADEVYGECERVLAEGEVPRSLISATMIQKRLGRGSKTTVLNHLKGWQRTAHTEPTTDVANVDTVMTTIRSNLDALVGQALAHQGERTRIRDAAAANEIDRLISELAAANLRIDALTANVDEHSSLVIELREEIAAQVRHALNLEGQVTLARDDLALAQDRLADLVAGRVPTDLRKRMGVSYLEDILRPRKPGSMG